MTGGSRKTRLRDGLIVLAIGACALGLRADAFQAAFGADDYAQIAMVEGRYPVARAPLELFTFSDGSRREAATLAQSGFYPWFVDRQLKLAMWRPLSSGLVWVDHALFGHRAFGYHVHSALWWLVLLYCVFALFEPLLGRAVALIALVFFALDETHGMALGWIAQRNSLISASFAALAVSAYIRHRIHGARRDAWLAAALISVALLGGEYAFCLVGYALGYELWLARDAPATRARSLCLLFAPALVYMITRSVLGFGAAGSGMYVDPIREAPEFIARASERFPTLLSDLVLGLRADCWLFGFPWTPQFVERGWLPPEAFIDFSAWRRIQETLGWFALAIAASLCWLTVRLARDRLRVVAMFATGTLLALVPPLTAQPSGRLLIAAQIGWSVVLALLVHGAVRRLRAPAAQVAPATATAGRFAAIVALLSALPHLTLFPAIGLQDLAVARVNVRNMYRAIVDADLGPPRAAAQRLLLVQSSDHLSPVYFSLIRSQYGKPVPKSVWTLSPSPLPVVVRRTAADTLELRYPVSGLMHGSLEPTVFRKAAPLPAAGAHFTLAGMDVEVLERRSDAITALRFRFESNLDRPPWQLLIPTPTGYARVPMPKIGSALELGVAPLPSPG